MPGPGRQPRGMKSQVKNPGELFLRLMKYVLKDYKFHCISVVVLIVVSVLCNVQISHCGSANPARVFSLHCRR